METDANIPSWIADRQFTDSLKWTSYQKTGMLPMWVADMDFRSPEPVIEALRKRVEEGVFGYAKESRDAAEAVVQWLSIRHGWNVNPDWLVWAPGVVSAIHVVCRAFAQPGEGVFTFTPVYPPFLWSPEASQRRTVTCPLKLADGRYQIDFDAFRSAVTDDTRVLLLCHPHNPIGRIWTADELVRLTDICLRRNILICSDEIHCDLLLDRGVRHIPAATLSQQVLENSITLMSPAKTFNLPGLNCGFAIIPNTSLRKRFKETARGIVPHVNIFGYTACRAAFAESGAWLKEVLEYLRQNHDLLYDTISTHLQPLSMIKAQATYLAWIDCRKLNVPNPRLLFEKAGVGVMDGTAFGQPGFVRLNFACSRAHLAEAIERIKKVVR